MKRCPVAVLLLATTLTAAPAVRADGDDAPLFRVFLKDGGSLVSYGELARLDDRVVFSMPTTASADNPELQLVSIASDRIDWARTTSYAESARASRYIAMRADSDYAALTARLTPSPAERTSLMAVALSNSDRNAAALPSAWLEETRVAIKAQIGREVELDRSYQALGTRMLGIAQVRARNADVRGVQRVI